MSDKIDPRISIPTYIGRKPCGCIVMAAVDDPADRDNKEVQKSLAKFVAQGLKDGLTIERVTVGFVRDSNFGCKCEDAKPARKTRQKKLLG